MERIGFICFGEKLHFCAGSEGVGEGYFFSFSLLCLKKLFGTFNEVGWKEPNLY